MATIISLGEQSRDALMRLPETGPGFQVVVRDSDPEQRPFLVLNAELALDLASIPELSSDSAASFNNGIRALEVLGTDPVRLIASPQPTRFSLVASRIAPAVASTTTSIPLTTSSSLIKTHSLPAPRGFHRFSPFNPDRRVDPKTGDFLPGTYACPASELAMIPTGLAAVGRLALPSLAPASWHYVAEAAAGTVVQFGTVAPGFGQAGGGVEAFFASGASNVGGARVPHRQIADE